MGKVEVFEAMTQLPSMAEAILAITCAFTFGSSNTASTTRSQPESAA